MRGSNRQTVEQGGAAAAANSMMTTQTDQPVRVVTIKRSNHDAEQIIHTMLLSHEVEHNRPSSKVFVSESKANDAVHRKL